MTLRAARPRLPAIRVPVQDTAGLVTAEPVWATRSSPPLSTAGMDGIAVRAADTIGASETTPVLLPPGSYDVVDTGDPMPNGRDAAFPRMRRDEALVFKVFDSATDGRARFTPHTSFEDPHSAGRCAATAKHRSAHVCVLLKQLISLARVI